MLHVGETTIGVPFTRAQAQQLDAAFSQLLKTVRGLGGAAAAPGFVPRPHPPRALTPRAVFHNASSCPLPCLRPRQFAEKQAAPRPKRWDMLEVRFKGDAADGTGDVTLFEVRRAPHPAAQWRWPWPWARNPPARASGTWTAHAPRAPARVPTPRPPDPTPCSPPARQVFCNPNAHATAFEAKLLLTLQVGGVSVTTEGRFSALKADVEAFLAQP
jgi:hypothetical protein